METPIPLMWKAAVTLQVHCLHWASSLGYCWKVPDLLAASLPHLSVELVHVFMQLPRELEQGNALARKENGFEWQFFISAEVPLCPHQQLCQLSIGNGTTANVIQ